MRDVAVVYGLCEPDTGELRYVGKTVCRPEGRFRSHVRKAYNGTEDLKSAWIRGLIDRGLEPDLIALEVCDPEDVLFYEATWIRGAWLAGCRLTNLAGVRRGR